MYYMHLYATNIPMKSPWSSRTLLASSWSVSVPFGRCIDSDGFASRCLLVSASGRSSRPWGSWGMAGSCDGVSKRWKINHTWCFPWKVIELNGGFPAMFDCGYSKMGVWMAKFGEDHEPREIWGSKLRPNSFHCLVTSEVQYGGFLSWG